MIVFINISPCFERGRDGEREGGMEAGGERERERREEEGERERGRRRGRGRRRRERARVRERSHNTVGQLLN